jgi:hypothetical protein
MNFGGNYHAIFFGSDKIFGFAEIYQCTTEGNKTTGVRLQTSSTVVPTIRGISLRALNVNVK